MNLNINVFDHISEDEIKDIVKETLVNQLKDQIKRETDRLIGNAAYYCAYRVLDDLLTPEQVEMVRENTIKILNGMTESTVFHRSYWNKEPHSTAYNIMDNTVITNREEIIRKTSQVISNFNFEEKLEDNCLNILQDAIIEKLSRKREE